jgi:hypothetical protein
MNRSSSTLSGVRANVRRSELARETDRAIEAAGFAIERCERFTFRIPPLDPPKTHVLGVARRA